MRPRHAVLLTPSISLRSVPLPHYLPKSFPCHRSENSPVSPAVATLPKTRVSNPCVCHTSEIPRGRYLTSQPALHPLPTSHPPVPLSRFPAIPFFFTLLRTLLHSPKPQSFCFQSLPHSLPKTAGGGGGVFRPVGKALSCHHAKKFIPATVKNRDFSGGPLVEYSSFASPRTRRREPSPPAWAAMLPSIRAQMRTWR